MYFHNFVQNLIQPSSSVVVRDLKELTILNQELYFQGSCGVLARAVPIAEAREEQLTSMIFLVEITISTFIDACRGKDITCPI